VGVGFGKWGYLFREYTDIVESEHDSGRYAKAGWKTTIDGIEGFERYLHPAHQFTYDEVHVGTVQEILPTLRVYDIVFFGDIIEHLMLDEGQAVLREAISHARKAVIITTPRYDTRQKTLCGNPLELHQSLWTVAALQSVSDCVVTPVDSDTLIAVFSSGATPRNVVRQWKRQASRLWLVERVRESISGVRNMATKARSVFASQGRHPRT